MDHLKLTIGLTLAGAGVLGFLLVMIGSRVGKSSAAWAAIIATAITAFVACRPLTGAYPNWPTTDAIYRGAWAAIPIAVVAIGLSFSRIPSWVRAAAALLIPAGLLVWIFTLYPAPDGTTQKMFLLEWAGISAGIVFILWLLVEPIARRSPGVAVPLVIGFLFAGLGALNLMSSSTKSGNLIAALGAVVGGALIAAILSKPISFARGPVMVWLALLCLLYVPSCYDADAVPIHSLIFILVSPLLAWLMEIKFFKEWKPWKRELLRGMLVAMPVIVGLVIGYKQMKANGDDEAMRWPTHSAAPICPSQIPIPSTINPPTMT